jgi:two-component system, OmpR family, response regulator
MEPGVAGSALWRLELTRFHRSRVYRDRPSLAPKSAKADLGGEPEGHFAGKRYVWEDWPLRLLVIEDDPDLNRQLTTALADAGYVVDRAFDGEEGHYLGESEPYDAVILDIGLPKMDGISVLEAWRRAGRAMPVLILTARDRWSDKVQGFDAGADDYVAKPFHLEEVLARIRALLRRSAGHAKSELNCGSVRLDTRTGRVSVDGNPVKLTSHEYRLLSYLMHHTGRVVSRSELVEHLYDQDFDRDSNTIEVFVGRIRKKLGVDVIQTVRGLGYLLTPPGNAP